MNTKLLSTALLLIVLLMSFTVMPVDVFANGTTPPATTEGGLPGVSIDANGNVAVDNIGEFDSEGGSRNAWNELLKKYRLFIAGVSGVASATFVVLFIIQFTKLGASAGNPMARSQATMGVLWTGIGAMGLGSVGIFFGFFYKALS